MKLLAVALLCLAAAASAADPYQARLASSKGVAVELQRGYRVVKVKLAGVEIPDAQTKAVGEFLAAETKDKDVAVEEYLKVGGDTLVFLAVDGKDLGRELLNRGLAKWWGRGSDIKDYHKISDLSQVIGIGMWSKPIATPTPTPIPTPDVSQRRTEPPQPMVYVQGPDLISTVLGVRRAQTAIQDGRQRNEFAPNPAPVFIPTAGDGFKTYDEMLKEAEDHAANSLGVTSPTGKAKLKAMSYDHTSMDLYNIASELRILNSRLR